MALLIALATIPFYKKWIWLTTMDDKVINCLCHLACIGAISYVLFLGGNYWFADPASTHEETCLLYTSILRALVRLRVIMVQ